MNADGIDIDNRLPRKRVLILVTDTGFGHRSAAEAVAGAIRLRYGHALTAAIVNPISETDAPEFVRSAQFDFDRIVRDWPQFYRLSNRITNLGLSRGLNEVALTFILYDSLSTVVKQYQPDVIVITHPALQYPLQGYMKISGANIPLVTVITDLVDLHRLWFSREIDRYFVPTALAAEKAEERGVSPDRIRVTGLPVHPALAQPAITPAQARGDLGLRADLFTVLAVSSKRVEGIYPFIHTLNHCGHPIQIIAVAGGDNDVWEQLRQTEWHAPARTFNYVEQMPPLIHAADCVMTKAGGLIVAESMACGRPMLIMQHRSLHEDGNARYVVDNGAGDLTEEPLQLLETLSHWLADGAALFRQRAAAARALGRPNAAFDVADAIFGLLQTDPSEAPRVSSSEQQQLRQLWEEFRLQAEG